MKVFTPENLYLEIEARSTIDWPIGANPVVNDATVQCTQLQFESHLNNGS